MDLLRSIFDPKLAELIPPSVGYDQQMQAVAEALDLHLAQLSADAKQCILLPRLDELDEKLINLLGNQWHVDFWDDQVSLADKRNLIRTSVARHRIRGTPAATEEIARVVFKLTNLTEWFEYGGLEPYYFRLLIDISKDDEDTSRAAINRLYRALDIVKNVRSWLEKIIFTVNYAEKFPELHESLALRAHLNHVDAYDYKLLAPFTHDGQPIYGESTPRADGTVLHDGHHFYENQPSAFYGLLQSPDFEKLAMRLSIKTIVEAVASDDRNDLLVSIIHNDAISSTDQSSLAVKLNFTDAYDYGLAKPPITPPPRGYFFERPKPIADFGGQSTYGESNKSYDGIEFNQQADPRDFLTYDGRPNHGRASLSYDGTLTMDGHQPQTYGNLHAHQPLSYDGTLTMDGQIDPQPRTSNYGQASRDASFGSNVINELTMDGAITYGAANPANHGQHLLEPVSYNGQGNYGGQRNSHDGQASLYDDQSAMKYGQLQPQSFESFTLKIRRRVTADGGFTMDGAASYDGWHEAVEHF